MYFFLFQISLTLLRKNECFYTNAFQQQKQQQQHQRQQE